LTLKIPQLKDDVVLFAPFLDAKEIYQSLIQQLVKDFSKVGFDIVLSTTEQRSFYELNTDVCAILNRMQINSPNSLPQLYYIIDLTESLIAEIYQSETDINFEIASLIIKRELQKVIYRQVFKQGDQA